MLLKPPMAKNQILFPNLWRKISINILKANYQKIWVKIWIQACLPLIVTTNKKLLCQLAITVHNANCLHFLPHSKLVGWLGGIFHTLNGIVLFISGLWTMFYPSECLLWHRESCRLSVALVYAAGANAMVSLLLCFRWSFQNISHDCI